MNNNEKCLQKRSEELNIAPLSNSEAPFWLPQYGHTFPDSGYHEFTVNTDIYRLEYVISGKGYINTKNFSFIVNAGDTYLLHRGDNHNYYSDTLNPMEKIWINFTGEFADNLINFFKLNDVVVFRKTNIYDLITRVHEVCKKHQDPKEYQLETMGEFTKLMHFLSNQHHISVSKIDHLDDIRAYMDLHILDNISLQDLANNLGLSQNQTIRRFKKKFGITPHQYIIKNKLRLARTLLRSSDKSIEEISDELNFANPVHFSQLFNDHVGMRPSKYRKSHIND